MSFVPNLRSKAPGQSYVPQKIDSLVDYKAFLTAAETAGSIVTGIANPGQYSVGVVGCGPAGVVAAYELLRMGVNVTIFADDWQAYRYGRTFSYPFPPGSGQYIAEMGAMRFPPSEAGLFFYLDKMGVKYDANFPDPGKVDTYLYLNGTRLTWKAGDSPPAIFDTVQSGLKAFMTEPVTLPNGAVLDAPGTITQYMLNGQKDQAFAAWQKWVSELEHVSFGAGLSMVFQLSRNRRAERNGPTTTWRSSERWASAAAASARSIRSRSSRSSACSSTNWKPTSSSFRPGSPRCSTRSLTRASTGSWY